MWTSLYWEKPPGSLRRARITRSLVHKREGTAILFIHRWWHKSEEVPSRHHRVQIKREALLIHNINIIVWHCCHLWRQGNHPLHFKSPPWAQAARLLPRTSVVRKMSGAPRPRLPVLVAWCKEVPLPPCDPHKEHHHHHHQDMSIMMRMLPASFYPLFPTTWMMTTCLPVMNNLEHQEQGRFCLFAPDLSLLLACLQSCSLHHLPRHKCLHWMPTTILFIAFAGPWAWNRVITQAPSLIAIAKRFLLFFSLCHDSLLFL